MKMKAAIRETYGMPKDIRVESLDAPVPGPNEILVKVHATTVNRTDCANLTAKPFIMRFVLGFLKPRKKIMGTDFSGVIVAIGKEVTGFKEKDRVFGFTDTGVESQAEFLTIKPDGKVLIIPEDINFKTAAAGIEGAHYAYTFIQKSNLQNGQRILINGATGAIGSALLQFVKQWDVSVTVTSNPQNIQRMKTLGADEVLDFTTTDFTTQGGTYDFIFDAVGKSTYGKCKKLLAKNGVYISSELGPYAQNLFLALFRPLTGHKKVVFPVPFPIQKSLPYIHEKLEKGIFKPLIDREYALDNISEAYTYTMTGQKTGNVIINMP